MNNTRDIEQEWNENIDFHCITCSDQALPARVLSIDEVLALATVAVGNATEQVDISLVDDVALGDMLLVHGGVALNNLGSDKQI